MTTIAITEGLMITALVVYSGMAAFTLVASVFSDTPLAFSIVDLYHKTKMNWFGCLLVWIGIIIINPFWWLVYKPVFYIGKFFKWLFTVGRK